MFAYRIMASPGRSIGQSYDHRRFAPRMKRLRDWVARAWRNYTTRHYLAEADDRTLADLGISRAQATFEASRWWWD